MTLNPTPNMMRTIAKTILPHRSAHSIRAGPTRAQRKHSPRYKHNSLHNQPYSEQLWDPCRLYNQQVQNRELRHMKKVKSDKNPKEI